MNSRELLNALSVAERLKDTTRHCYTSKGRHESVAEHSWMMTLMAFFSVPLIGLIFVIAIFPQAPPLFLLCPLGRRCPYCSRALLSD